MTGHAVLRGVGDVALDVRAEPLRSVVTAGTPMAMDSIGV
jgi:hypothetical protein